MYNLTNDRRITQFIKSEARKWLYANMPRYVFDQNDENKKLYSEIFTKAEKDIYGNNAVPERLYAKFLEMFDNNPIKHKIKCLSKKDSITSEDIYMYFINYNNYILPIGFIIEFFEDDFEDGRKINALIKDFLADAEKETQIEWEKIKFESSTAVERQKNALGNIYKCTAATYVKYLFILGFYMIILGCFLSFVSNFSEYEAYAVLVNIYLAVYMLIMLPCLIIETIYILKCAYVQILLRLHTDIARKCQDTGGENLRELSRALIAEYLVSPRNIGDIKPLPDVIKMFDSLDKYNVMLERDPAGRTEYDKYAGVNNRYGFNMKFLVVFMVFTVIVALCVTLPPSKGFIDGLFG